MGEKDIPENPPGDVYDVTAPPYNAPYAPYDENNPGAADATGLDDATAAIQQALDDAGAAGGGVVYLPAGTYSVKPPDGGRQALLIGDSGVVLRGDGSGQTFVFNNNPVMRWTGIIGAGSRVQGWRGWSHGVGQVVADDGTVPPERASRWNDQAWRDGHGTVPTEGSACPARDHTPGAAPVSGHAALQPGPVWRSQ